MDRRKSLPVWLLIALSLVSFSGCGWWSAQADNAVEEDLAESADDAAPPAAASSPPVNSQKPEPGLKTGDHFPLLKTVEQTLRQPAPQGWIVSRSALEMLLSATVEEIHPVERQHAEADSRSGQKRLQVKYQHIHFSQDVPGQPRVEYDSNAPAFPIPQVAEGYHHFDFWLSAENQVLELVAVDQFINRCLKDLPLERRQQALPSMTVASAVDGVASFVDDSIGLLPAIAIREGDSWTRERQVLQPVPLQTSTRYTLRHLTPEIAEIEIQGTISPMALAGAASPHGDVTVAVRVGQSHGKCLLDRRTGLPVQSRLEQSLEMNVRLADGSEFDQHKSTVTTIKSLAEETIRR
jgi:hypothetical protein